MKGKFLVIIWFFTTLIFGQNVNIIPQLKKIEAGKIVEVKDDLEELKKNNSGDPNVIFLEAVLTEDGDKSKNFYELIYNDFPNCKFADASLFRNFSYYYAIGLYKKAEGLKKRLLKDYPKSPYLKNTDRNFPEVDDMIIVDSAPYKIKNQTAERFTVQAGAFSNFKNAEDLKSKFILDGFFARIIPKTVNNLQFHTVTVGNFLSRAETDIFLNELQNNYSIKGRVIILD